MSCDYNIRFKPKRKEQLNNIVTEMFTEDELLFIELEKITDLNIPVCHTAIGWRPMFYSNKFFSNMEELKNFMQQHKDTITIEDEYGIEVPLEQLIELANMAKHNNSQPYTIEIDGYDFTRYIDE